ncbi:MAG TPA: DUF4345 family protein [Actinomycetota bacterium]|nr:DUF4345 family protein [Actinomycetota bacterium]
MRGVRGYLFVVGIVFLVFGAIYLFAPEVLTDPTGFGNLKPEVFTDVRATYGGLQLAIGLFCLWSGMRSQHHRAALTLVVMTFGAVAGSRAVGLLIDREPTTAMISALSFEIVMSAVSAVILSRHGRETRVSG